jgi:hypothetical protein
MGFKMGLDFSGTLKTLFLIYRLVRYLTIFEEKKFWSILPFGQKKSKKCFSPNIGKLRTNRKLVE